MTTVVGVARRSSSPPASGHSGMWPRPPWDLDSRFWARSLPGFYIRPTPPVFKKPNVGTGEVLIRAGEQKPSSFFKFFVVT